jgi:hypothetical protein
MSHGIAFLFLVYTSYIYKDIQTLLQHINSLKLETDETYTNKHLTLNQFGFTPGSRRVFPIPAAE